jgi:hypothetical protein
MASSQNVGEQALPQTTMQGTVQITRKGLMRQPDYLPASSHARGTTPPCALMGAVCSLCVNVANAEHIQGPSRGLLYSRMMRHRMVSQRLWRRQALLASKRHLHGASNGLQEIPF